MGEHYRWQDRNPGGCRSSYRGNRLHGFATLRAQDVLFVGEESTADEGGVAPIAAEAVAVPVAVVEGDELGATQTCEEKKKDGLTQWPLGDFNDILEKSFSS